MGVGPVCWTSLPTGLSEWELGPCHTEQSPINKHQTVLVLEPQPVSLKPHPHPEQHFCFKFFSKC